MKQLWAAFLIATSVGMPPAFSRPQQDDTDTLLDTVHEQYETWKSEINQQKDNILNKYHKLFNDEDLLKRRREFFECQMKEGWLFDDTKPIPKNDPNDPQAYAKKPKFVSKKELNEFFKVLHEEKSTWPCAEDRMGDGYDGKSFQDDLFTRSKVFPVYKQSRIGGRFKQLYREHLSQAMRWLGIVDEITTFLTKAEQLKGYYIEQIVPDEKVKLAEYRSVAYARAQKQLHDAEQMETDAYRRPELAPDGYDVNAGFHMRKIHEVKRTKSMESGVSGSDLILDAVTEEPEHHFFHASQFAEIGPEQESLDNEFRRRSEFEGSGDADFEAVAVKLKATADTIVKGLDSCRVMIEVAQGERSDIRGLISNQEGLKDRILRPYNREFSLFERGKRTSEPVYPTKSINDIDARIAELQWHLDTSILDMNHYVYFSTFAPANNPAEYAWAVPRQPDFRAQVEARSGSSSWASSGSPSETTEAEYQREPSRRTIDADRWNQSRETAAQTGLYVYRPETSEAETREIESISTSASTSPTLLERVGNWFSSLFETREVTPEEQERATADYNRWLQDREGRDPSPVNEEPARRKTIEPTSTTSTEDKEQKAKARYQGFMDRVYGRDKKAVPSTSSTPAQSVTKEETKTETPIIRYRSTPRTTEKSPAGRDGPNP